MFWCPTGGPFYATSKREALSQPWGAGKGLLVASSLCCFRIQGPVLFLGSVNSGTPGNLFISDSQQGSQVRLEKSDAAGWNGGAVCMMQLS